MGREFGRKCFLAAPLCLGWKSAGRVGAAISGGGEDLHRGLAARGLHGEYREHWWTVLAVLVIRTASLPE